jgi:amphi-Trp domain-containing protein
VGDVRARVSDHEDHDHGGEQGGDHAGQEVVVETTRDAAAGVLRRLAAAVDTGGVEVGAADPVTVAVPEQVGVTVEYEMAGGRAELEVELEWDVADAGGEAAASEEEPGEEPTEEVLPDEGAVVTPVTSKARFELYEDRADEWRWRLVHRNGNVIADGGEGYTRKRTAMQGLESVRRNAPGAPVEEQE